MTTRASWYPRRRATGLAAAVTVCGVAVAGCSSQADPTGAPPDRTAATVARSPEAQRGYVLDDPRTAHEPRPTCGPAVSDWVVTGSSVEVTVNVNGPTTVRVRVETEGGPLSRIQQVRTSFGTVTFDFRRIPAPAVKSVTVSASGNARYTGGRCTAKYSATG